MGGRLLSTEHPEKPFSGVLSAKESRLGLRSKRKSPLNILATNLEQKFGSLRARQSRPICDFSLSATPSHAE
jgi:hypothetical protein